MFYDNILLNSQHQSKFGAAWVVSTLGVKYVDKKKLEAVDIVKLCDNLMEFISSESTLPTKRFSLKLSSYLMDGTLKIFRAQVLNLEKQAVKAIGTCNFSGTGVESDGGETPATPKSKRKRITKKAPAEEIVTFTQARPHQITIQEDFPRQGEAIVKEQVLADTIMIELPEELPERASRDKIGASGAAAASVNIPEIIVLKHSEQVERPAESLTLSAVEKDTILEKSKEKPRGITSKKRGEPIGSLSVRWTTDKLEGRPSGLVQGPPEEPLQVPAISEAPIQIPVTPIQIPVTPKAPDEPIAGVSVPIPDISEVTEPRRKKQKTKWSELLLTTRKPRPYFQVINRRETEIIIMPEYPMEQVTCGDLTGGLDDLLQLLQGRDDGPVEGARPNNIESLSKLQSLSGLPASGAGLSANDLLRLSEFPQILVTSPEPIERKDSEPGRISSIAEAPLTPMVTSSPVTSKRGRDEGKTIVEEEVASKRQRLMVPRLKTFSDSRPTFGTSVSAIEPIIEEGSALPTRSISAIQPAAEEEEVASVSSEYRKIASEIRQQNIVDLIINWNPYDGKITLEAVAKKPLNKFNIARAFGDLLVLSKKQYVKLITEDDSLVLKYIEKGPKLDHLV